MLVTRFTAWILVFTLLLSTLGEAQTSTQPAPARKASGQQKAAEQQKSAAALDSQIQRYQELLNDVDVSSDPDIKHAVYMKWAETTCRSKQLKLQQILGTADARLSDAVQSACLNRLMTQEAKGAPPVGNAKDTPSPDTKTNAVNSPPPVEPPPGCTPVLSLLRNFNVNKPNDKVQYQPAQDKWTVPAHWVQLDPNRSGAEISTKSMVWVGFVNRLRYSATLGGVVTAIATPTIPSTIFPTLKSPQATKGGQPAALAAAEIEGFRKCLTDTSTFIASFQDALGQEEILLNETRERIRNRLDSLQPVVNSLQEARDAGEPSIFPKNEIPPFPIGDVRQLRDVLTDLRERLTELEPWAKANPPQDATLQSLESLADVLSKTLDGYLNLPAQTSAVAAGGPAQPNDKSPGGQGAGAGGTGGNPTVTTAGATPSGPATTGGRTPAATPSPSPARTAKPSPSPKPGASPSPSPKSSPSPAAPTTPQAPAPRAAATPKDNTPASIPVGSEEVQLYEANRVYVNEWIDAFHKVATASPEYFIESFKPACGGWFGQGTSTQMQLTVLDNVYPETTTPPTARNLDKVVCQPRLTVTSGLGLSFVADNTPAFVAGIKKDAQGNSVLDASGNPVIIQTIGFSSSAAIRPAYALQVDAALWNLGPHVEMHWGLGAMLTAANGGATTDIITGPAFSFRRRTFFVTPVYDLGLRTTLLNGFTPGQPQGNLTSPPTQQVWKSGFGLTITFPFTPGNNNTPTNSSGNPPAASVAPAKPGGSGTGGNGGTGGGTPGQGGGKKPTGSGQ